MGRDNVLKIVTHSATVLEVATAHGWIPGARYTNLRDVRRFNHLGFLDIDWKRYNFERHLRCAEETRPFLTVARDVEDRKDLRAIIDQAYKLNEFCDLVIIVPKDEALASDLEDQIPKEFVLGYSVPTRYGGTRIPPGAFRRPTHLLGGRPDVQRRLAELLPVFSIDGNRFTLDAGFGDYFDGERFRPHPIGGYRNCLIDSVRNITRLWDNYQTKTSGAGHPRWSYSQNRRKLGAIS